MTRILVPATPSVSSQFVSRCTREWLPGWRCISSATEKRRQKKCTNTITQACWWSIFRGKLARLVESDALIANTARLVQGQVLGLPVVWLEQNPDKLGATVPELQIAAGRRSCAAQIQLRRPGEPTVATALARKRVEHWLVCGIETHICVYQSVLGLLASGTGSRWWWMRCRLAPLPTGISPSASLRPGELR